MIGATKTTKGLTVKANLDEKIYKTGIKVTDEEKERINIKRNDFHGEWDYIISGNLILLLIENSLASLPSAIQGFSKQGRQICENTTLFLHKTFNILQFAYI